MKKLVCASLMVFMLCAPALADSSSTVRQPATGKPVRLEVAVKVGSAVRIHDLMVVEHGCAELTEKARDHQDEIRVCLDSSGGTDVQLSVDWATHEADNELRTKSATIVARGSTMELGGGAMRLSIAVK